MIQDSHYSTVDIGGLLELVLMEMGKHLASLQSHMSANSRISDYMVSYNFRTTGKNNSHLSCKTNPIRYTCRTNLIFTSIWYGIFIRPSRSLELLRHRGDTSGTQHWMQVRYVQNSGESSF